MVQVTFDTTSDTIDELKDALRILQTAIERRDTAPATPAAAPHTTPSPAVAVATAAPRLDMPLVDEEPAEETAVDTSFFKITLKHDDAQHATSPTAPQDTPSTAPKGPTLNQLLSESITEEELTRMFKQTGNEPAEATGKSLKHEEPVAETSDANAYLEIVEYTDEKE